jgi:hypothetical protein
MTRLLLETNRICSRHPVCEFRGGNAFLGYLPIRPDNVPIGPASSALLPTFPRRRFLGAVKVALSVRAYFPELGIVAPGGERCTREVEPWDEYWIAQRTFTHGAYASTLFGCPWGAQAPVDD